MKHNRILALILILLLASGALGSAFAEPIVIVDDVGRTVELEKPLERVAVFNKMNVEIVRALGKIDPVVGIDANTAQDEAYWPELDLNAIAGQKQTELNYEAIVAMNPDAVILPSNGSWEEAEEKLEPFGIPVIVATGWENTNFEPQVRILAAAFGVEEKGQEYIDFCNGPIDLIRERMDSVPESERKSVYFENSGDYCTCLVGSGWNDMIVLGGGVNLFGDINFADADTSKGSVHSFAVDPELILERNPDVILYNVYSTAAKSGTSIYVEMDPSEIPDVLSEICKRPGWENLDAVQNGQVYGFTAFTGNACFKIVASCYIAKWLYPDLFADLDPEAFYNEWLTVYQGAAPLGEGQVGQIH